MRHTWNRPTTADELRCYRCGANPRTTDDDCHANPGGTPRPTRPLMERVEERIVRNANGCWLFTGPKNRDGYSVIRDNLRPRPGHRVVYEALVGPIPAGLTLHHLCFERSCVNPDHLRPVTNQENARNQRSAFKTHCVHGHEYTPENTIVRTSRYGRRQCRTCTLAAARRYREREKARLAK